MHEEIKSLKILTVTSIIIVPAILAGIFLYSRFKGIESEIIVKNTWNGYRYYFIEEDGRVKRPKDDDTVSEGQAYAMSRAVWMDDKETFDRCYIWTENNLSRKKEKNDNLLAWRWKDGKVADWMPASDADIDYALSLIFADSRWKESAPKDVRDYGKKARDILNDILTLETYSTSSGRLYLSPWVLQDKENISRLPVNPSYYSPAHFRIFYEYTKDERWLKLADTAYYILNSLSREFNGKKGVGLIPDWCSVDNNDDFYPLEGKNPEFGWEAIRVPLRLALDYLWFKSKDAKRFFNSGLSQFIEKEWINNKALFCEYSYAGEPIRRYENPLFYASYYCALYVSGSRYAQDLLSKTRSHIKRYNNRWVYLSDDEYYVNSLAWFGEIFYSGIIKPVK